MKNNIAFLCLLAFLFLSCSPEEKNTDISINFTHHWDGVEISNQDLNQLKFVTKNGENISVEKLRYLISEISLIDFKNYHLINFSENTAT